MMGPFPYLIKKSTGKIIRVHQKSDLTIKGKLKSDTDKFLVKGEENESVNSEVCAKSDILFKTYEFSKLMNPCHRGSFGWQ